MQSGAREAHKQLKDKQRQLLESLPLQQSVRLSARPRRPACTRGRRFALGDTDGADEAAPSGKKRRKPKGERPAEDEAPEAGEGAEEEAAAATPRAGKADKRKQQMRSRAQKIQKDAAGSE